MTYKQQRVYQNIQLGDFETEGKYDIPKIQPFTGVFEPCDFIGFNYAKNEKNPENKGLHFYLDDYQFERLWNNPSRYVDMLSRFKYVLSPDFSLYTDFPTALNIYNHYRKHWLSAYFQSYGVNIIPTICWSTPDSFQWCFDGEPKNSIVTLASIGVCQSKKAIEAFREGYAEMEKRLSPKQVLFFGKPILEDGLTIAPTHSNVFYMETDQQRRLKHLRANSQNK